MPAKSHPCKQDFQSMSLRPLCKVYSTQPSLAFSVSLLFCFFYESHFVSLPHTFCCYNFRFELGSDSGYCYPLPHPLWGLLVLGLYLFSDLLGLSVMYFLPTLCIHPVMSLFRGNSFGHKHTHYGMTGFSRATFQCFFLISLLNCLPLLLSHLTSSLHQFQTDCSIVFDHAPGHKLLHCDPNKFGPFAEVVAFESSLRGWFRPQVGSCLFGSLW